MKEDDFPQYKNVKKKFFSTIKFYQMVNNCLYQLLYAGVGRLIFGCQWYADRHFLSSKIICRSRIDRSKQVNLCLMHVRNADGFKKRMLKFDNFPDRQRIFIC